MAKAQPQGFQSEVGLVAGAGGMLKHRRWGAVLRSGCSSEGCTSTLGALQQSGLDFICHLYLQGKQKYTLPLYRSMWSGSESARVLATETFSATAPQLHVNVQNYIKKILGLEPAGS